jgi:hypothetical protein
VVAHRAVDVDDRIGHLAARLVDHVVDVEPVVRHRGRDLASMLGTFALAIANAERRLAHHLDAWEVDGVADASVLQELAQLVDDHDGAIFLGLRVEGAEMRQRDDAGLANELRASGNR